MEYLGYFEFTLPKPCEPKRYKTLRIENKCFKGSRLSLQDLKGACNYLGKVNYLKCFIPDFSMLTYLLRNLHIATLSSNGIKNFCQTNR